MVYETPILVIKMINYTYIFEIETKRRKKMRKNYPKMGEKEASRPPKQQENLRRMGDLRSFAG